MTTVLEVRSAQRHHLRHHVLGEQVAFLEVLIPRKGERRYFQVSKLADHSRSPIGITHDGVSHTAERTTGARQQVPLYVFVDLRITNPFTTASIRLEKLESCKVPFQLKK